MIPENIHTTPRAALWNSEGEGGTLTWNSEGMGVCVSEFRGHGGELNDLDFRRDVCRKEEKSSDQRLLQRWS